MIGGTGVGKRLVKFSSGFALGASLVVSTHVMNKNAFAGQNTPTAAASTPTAAGMVTLREATDVKLKFAETLSSKTATEGDAVNFRLDEYVKAGDVVVAREGAMAVGEVSHAKKSGHFGSGGELSIRLNYLKVGDNRVRLRGSKGKEGDSKTGATVALTVLFGPLGLLKHGKQVEVKEGTPLTAYVDQDIALPPAR